MAYATKADIVALHGQDFVDRIADRDGNGLPDDEAVAAALELASGEIDTRLSVRYATPLTVVPSIVKTAAVEIAVYRLADNGNSLTEDIRKRYEDMIALMKEVAAGKANVGLPAVDDTAEPGGSDFHVAKVLFGRTFRGG